MLSRSRLSRRLSRLAEVVEIIIHQLGVTLKELNKESRYALDSFPIAVYDNIFRCWQTRTNYDEARYVECLRRKGRS